MEWPGFNGEDGWLIWVGAKEEVLEDARRKITYDGEVVLVSSTW